jgi:hypothetical protein
MTWMKRYSTDMFSPEFEARQAAEKLERAKRLQEFQQGVATESEVFARVLKQEWRDDPLENLESTDSPESKVRNALISRHAYPDLARWERQLLSDPFYGLSE